MHIVDMKAVQNIVGKILYNIYENRVKRINRNTRCDQVDFTE